MDQSITSSRILNADGSIPRTTDELIARGFQKLRDDRERRRKEKEVPPRNISDTSTKSSATYVCLSPQHPNRSIRDTRSERSDRTVIHRPQDTRSANSSSSTEIPSAASIQVGDTKMRLTMSLESHEAKIRAMQAEIAALKRAAILTRELRSETAREQSTNETKEADGGRGEGRSAAIDAVMSGGNGMGDEHTMHHINGSMEGMPTPPQLLPFELRHAPERRPSQRSDTKHAKLSAREKLCLCPSCISVTQKVMNSLVARYSTQDEHQNATIARSHHARSNHIQKLPGKREHAALAKTQREHYSNIQKSPRRTKSLLINPNSRPCHVHASHISLTTQNGYSSDSKTHKRSISISDIYSRSKDARKENSRPETPESPDYYLQKLKEIGDAPCHCYVCKAVENRQEFERKHAEFPPYKNGRTAVGRDRNGYWVW